MKKLCSILVVISLMCTLLCACGEKKEEAVISGEVVENETENNGIIENVLSRDEYKILYKDAEFSLGDVFENIKSGLGEEVKPSEKIKPCVPDSEEVTMYTYDGISIQVSYNGQIISATFNNDIPSFANGIKVGSNPSDYGVLLGPATFESEFGSNYGTGDIQLAFVYDDDGLISSISIEDVSIDF